MAGITDLQEKYQKALAKYTEAKSKVEATRGELQAVKPPVTQSIDAILLYLKVKREESEAPSVGPSPLLSEATAKANEAGTALSNTTKFNHASEAHAAALTEAMCWRTRVQELKEQLDSSLEPSS